MATKWKQDHANASEHAFKHELVVGVIEEYLDNLSHNFGVSKDDAFVRYGLKKCMSYAAQVARAEALNIDPDLLRADAAAITEQQTIIIEEAERAGVPVIVVVEGGG
jgi:stalled ribosome rescue protein Dom34